MSNGFRANPADTNTNTKGKNMTAHARTTGLAILIAAKAIWGLAGEIRTTEVNGISWTYEITSEEEKTAMLAFTMDDDDLPCATIASAIEDHVVIPQEIDNYRITKIGPSAFYNCKISGITIPDTIKTIDRTAFQRCSNLKDVVLSEGLLSIGNNAFYKTNITSISIPSSVTNINDFAFSQCEHLSSVTLLGTNTKISPNAFEKCDNLTDLYMSAGTSESITATSLSAALPSITIKTLTRFDESCESFMTRLTPPSTPGGKWQITAFASVAGGDANGLSTGNVRVLCGTRPDALTASIPAHLATTTNAVMVRLEFDRPDDAAVQYYKVSFGY